ncbi:TPA_asm: hypothetical protein [Amaranthus tuberculatus amalgavirus 3]|nr:TPA_asm: hypothetical protein [Amaranthus tuberculatus amalgavirus 3]
MAGSSSARDVYIPTVAVDLGEALRDTLAPLGRHGFNVNRWDKATVNAHFLSVKKFIDNVKILSNIEDHDLRTSLIQKGITLNHFKTPADANPSQLDDFCMWLKKPEGTKFLNKLQKDRALARRVQGSHTVSDVALVSLLNEQLSDYHAWVKETRSEYDDAEKALLRELDLLREDRENVLHDGMVGFRPAADYVEPIEKHLNQKCWLVYLEECRRNNKTPLEGDDDNFKTMRELYGPQVRQELQVEFLKAGSRVEDLKCWADKKILYLGEMGERKKSSTFRSYLDNSGGAVSDEVRQQAEVRLASQRRGRPLRSRILQGIDAANLVTYKRRKQSGNATGSTQAAAPPVTEVGTGGTDGGNPELQLAVTGPDSAQGGVGGSDPPRQEQV